MRAASYNISQAFSDQVAASHPDTLQTLRDELSSLGSKHGFGYFSYLANPDPHVTFDKNIILTTYPKSWSERYRECEYHRIDPAVEYGLKGILPVDWTGIPKEDKKISTFFGESREFGVHPNGITIPVRDQHGGRAVLAVNVEASAREWPALSRELVPDLTYLAFLFHNAALNITSQDFRGKHELSDREIDIMRWTAHGKTRWETSVIMGLSEGTVKAYAASAIAKLGCASQAQAVARCISHGLFAVP